MKFHVSGKILALVLTAVLAVAMFPVSAFAANGMMSVTGTVTDFDFAGNFVVETDNGGSNTFHYGGNDPVFLAKDDTVKVYFLPEDPGTALKVVVLSIANTPAPVQHTHYSVTGTITDATMNTITILSKGKYYTFGREDAELVNVKDGILLGDTVEVTVADDDRQRALQIEMIAMGGNHEKHPAQSVTHYSITGHIADMTMNTITIIYKNKYYSFTTEDARKVGTKDGFALGDTVKVTVGADDKQVAKEIRMIRYGKNH